MRAPEPIRNQASPTKTGPAAPVSQSAHLRQRRVLQETVSAGVEAELRQALVRQPAIETHRSNFLKHRKTSGAQYAQALGMRGLTRQCGGESKGRGEPVRLEDGRRRLRRERDE